MATRDSTMAPPPGSTMDGEKGYETGRGDRTKLRLPIVVLRFLAFGATLAAFVTMLTSNQTVQVFVPQLGFPVRIPAKFRYSDAFIWFLVANGLAFAYLLLTALLTICVRSVKVLRALLLLDLIVAFILLSGASAATAVGYIGQNGIKESNWSPLCGTFNRYCHHVLGALVASYLGWVFLFLAIMLSLHIRR